ncbi:unnamed protein product [Anisakis simplex]|uniref:valine--tRNA ligase n=1 Tax=Anisakis simplex TaxID=6269 RepID=A0A0M3JXN1_ANISI|nr:unnamed protein product [Anisakis simplex]
MLGSRKSGQKSKSVLNVFRAGDAGKRGLQLDDQVEKSTFDLPAVIENYEQRTKLAAVNRWKTYRESDDNFSIVLPPPNVTGKLHLGHALTVTIEDVICRYKRAYGHQVRWHVGFDHAGIATQTIVEKYLWDKRKCRRYELSRGEFVELCNEWKEKRAEEISEQLKKLGATLDWSSNPYYTMDCRFSQAVTRAFCQLHSDGLIFRKKRLVNWCPTLQSTLSDQEVDHIDLNETKVLNVPSADCSANKIKIRVGQLFHIRYKLIENDNRGGLKYLEVATGRPETIFADCALAVHPNDSRYNHLIGKFVQHPFLVDCVLPIIADESVKMQKGTGVLKITPYHDFIDFDIANRHKDEIDEKLLGKYCLDEKARLINTNTLFDGMDRFEARTKVIERLRELDAYGGEAVNEDARIGICSRTGDVVEPMLKEQWWLNCDEINSSILEALHQGQASSFSILSVTSISIHLFDFHVTVTPKLLSVKLEEWLENKEPWCLSRQLVWGHRVPAYRNIQTGEWISAMNEADARRRFGIDSKDDFDVIVERDSDVLDTWFSSSLVPLVVNGWPAKQIESTPLSLMETGHDIIGFWVARMLTVCHRLIGQLPFEKILLHGLIRDSKGRKMSKSLGNVIDPNDIINGVSLNEMVDRLSRSQLSDSERSIDSLIDLVFVEIAISDLQKTYPKGITECGPDALRFALLRHDLNALDVNVNVMEKAIEGLRFCNKLWNLCEYAKRIWFKTPSSSSSKHSVGSERDYRAERKYQHIADRWIRSCLGNTVRSMRSYIDQGAIHLAFQCCHRFILAQLCDIYLETTKKALWNDDTERLKQISDNLHEILEHSFVLLSMFMPFVSEYLFDSIKTDKHLSLYDKRLKENDFVNAIDNDLEKRVCAGLAIVSTIRSLRQQFQLPVKVPLNVDVYCDEAMNDIEVLLCDLGNFTISTYHQFTTKVNDSQLVVPVSGYSILLVLLLNSEYSGILRKRIETQLERAVHRMAQFEAKAVKYERIVENLEVKGNSRMKSCRKAAQARKVVKGMDEEAKKLKNLLNYMERDGITSKDTHSEFVK